LLFGLLSGINNRINRLDGILGVLWALLGEEGEIDLIVFIKELVGAVLRDVDLLSKLIVEFGLPIFARFELDVNTAAVEHSKVLPTLQESVNVEAFHSTLELHGGNLVDTVFSFDERLAGGLLIIDGWLGSLLGLLQVLEAERKLIELNVLFLHDLLGIAMVLVAVLGAEVAHATEAILLLLDRSLRGKLARIRSVAVKVLV